ncbi:hypothetical protein HU200_003184 [Digitaria exilis]|uniref:Uncharacterized protein n=1 Tax=Digitaria exilis TaxID=1010633 RepID=A0A835FTX3_9POAL|nr:hypothetical protein HU200_003184 [Digitaria exilis]
MERGLGDQRKNHPR